ncbi:ABC transporter ATP-binding protein, partial [Acuticoccus mangrovi]|nr:ATP-binding cassette domain-containing protein [Acuticoccus mangrovi]
MAEAALITPAAAKETVVARHSAGAAITVDDVRKVYGGRVPVEAVSGVTFDVPRGEFVAILGPSGCGKSTLLMMAGGLEPASSGTITVDGTPMMGPRETIGIMFQDASLLPWKTVMENILFPIRILKRPVGEYRERARQLIELTGLAGFENARPHQLSGGMRQRVAICRALVYDPDIL